MKKQSNQRNFGILESVTVCNIRFFSRFRQISTARESTFAGCRKRKGDRNGGFIGPKTPRTVCGFCFFGMLIPAVLFWGGLARADMTLDGSMGTAGKINGPVYDIRPEYGRTAGENLFHSFADFSVGVEETADFGVTGAVRNVIGRVTGGELSRIDGVLRTTLTGTGGVADANLFLLNPAGVVFGPSARLDIGGSFYAAAADYLRMGDTERFYAAGGDEILSAAPPAAFGFLTPPAAGVTVEGAGQVETSAPAGLQVTSGESIVLAGGEIQMGGTFHSPSEGVKNPLGTLHAPDGRIEVTAAAAAGEVPFGGDTAGEPAIAAFGNILMNDAARLDTSGAGEGSIYIRGGEFRMSGESELLSDSRGDGAGGIIDIRADLVELTSASIFTDAFSAGMGGRIRITGHNEPAAEVSVTDMSRIFADTYDETDSAGDAGSVFIEAETIRVANFSQISGESAGRGDGGLVHLRADRLEMETESTLFSGTTRPDETAGAGGDLIIETVVLQAGGNSRINADTFGGRGGNVIIGGKDGRMAQRVALSGSNIFAGSFYQPEGDGPAGDAGRAGSVEIRTESLTLSQGAAVGTETYGAGQGGEVTITAQDARFSGTSTGGVPSRVYTTAESTAQYAGDAGNIHLSGGRYRFEDGAGIYADTKGPGDGGTITIDADRVELTDAAQISCESSAPAGGGDAGFIDIHTRYWLLVRDGSAVTTEAASAGGGQIRLSTDFLIYPKDSRIATSVRAGGDDAGDITLADSPFLAVNDSRIVANAYAGRGGNINIRSAHTMQSPQSLIDASSLLGIDGTVNIESPDTDRAIALTVLPTDPLDASRWLQTPCAARGGESAGRFVYQRRDGSPVFPDDWLPPPLLQMANDEFMKSP